MTEIYINNQLIDLYSNEEVVLTFGVNDLFSIETRQGTYSNTFKVPATHNNNQILQQANNILSTTNIFVQKLPCRILVDGILQVEGVAEIKNASEIEYEVNVYAGNTSWFDAIEDKSLQEYMADCDFAFNWDEAHVIANRSNVWTDGFIYPNIDYGNLFFEPAVPNVNWYELYPAVFCKYLFREIFQQAGYTINSDWFDNNALFEKQIIPFSSLWKRDKKYELRNYFKGQAAINFFPPDVATGPLGQNHFILPIIDSNCYDFSSDVDWIDPNGLTGNDADMGFHYRLLDNAKIKFEYDFTVVRNVAFPAIVDLIQFGYYDFDNNFVGNTLFNLTGQPNGTYNFTGTFTIDAGRGAMFFNLNGTLEVLAGSYIEILEYTPDESDEGVYEINQYFNWSTIGATLPDISAKDFILCLANQYGLIFEQNLITNIIDIYQFDKLTQNLSNPIDWSNKIDLEEYPVISYIASEYQRNNYLRYAEDSEDEYLTELGTYGEGNIIIGNATAGTEQELYVAPFAPVIRIMTLAGGVPGAGIVEMGYIPIYESGTFTQVTPRMAYIEQDASTIITIMPSATSSLLQPNVYFTDLVFQNLINTYYANVEPILNNGKAVGCLLRINNLDISTLDFSRPIWIDYFKAYFYINEISQYKVTSKDSTQVTLILLTN